jgi:hypothetical protein
MALEAERRKKPSPSPEAAAQYLRFLGFEVTQTITLILPVVKLGNPTSW